MPCKIYAHIEVEERPCFALPIQVGRPEETQFGTIKDALLKEYSERFPDEGGIDYESHCFWNQDFCPIPDGSSVALFSSEHNDFFLRPLPHGEGASGALRDSREKRGELSYYYAHDRQRQSLISKPQVQAAAAVASAVPERVPVKAPPLSTAAHYNTKQSPFGTDIAGYESVTTYTWEDNDGDFVKVLVPLEGVGKLLPERVRSNFGTRSFELLVEGLGGKNLRFACYKTHGEIKPEECKHVVRANRVNLVLRKAKDKEHWFDLFKKRAIGDDDDP